MDYFYTLRNARTQITLNKNSQWLYNLKIIYFNDWLAKSLLLGTCLILLLLLLMISGSSPKLGFLILYLLKRLALSVKLMDAFWHLYTLLPSKNLYQREYIWYGEPSVIPVRMWINSQGGNDGYGLKTSFRNWGTSTRGMLNACAANPVVRTSSRGTSGSFKTIYFIFKHRQEENLLESVS